MRLLEVIAADSKKGQQLYSASGSDLPPPTLDSIKRLHILSTTKLLEMVRKSGAKESGWDGVNEAEVIAARELLSRDIPQVAR